MELTRKEKVKPSLGEEGQDGILIQFYYAQTPAASTSNNDQPQPSDGFNLPIPGTIYCGPGNYAPLAPHPGIDQCCAAHDACYGSLGGLDVITHPFGIGSGAKQSACDHALCGCAAGKLLTGPESFFVGIGVMAIFCPRF